MRLYSWKCAEPGCRAKGKRWFKEWYGFRGSPFDAAGNHADRCKAARSNLLGEHPHKECPNHMVVSKEAALRGEGGE